MLSAEAFEPRYDEQRVLYDLMRDHPKNVELVGHMRQISKVERSVRPALFTEIERVATLQRRLARQGYDVSRGNANRHRAYAIQRGMVLGVAAVQHSTTHRWTLDAWDRRAAAGQANDLDDMERFRALQQVEARWSIDSPHVVGRLCYVTPSLSRGPYNGDFRRSVMYVIHTAGTFVEESNQELFIEHMDQVGFPKFEADQITHDVSAYYD